MPSIDEKAAPGARASEASARLEEMLAKAEDGIGLFSKLADELDEAVFVVDRDQTVLLFNRKAEELTGFERDQILGRHCLRGIRCSRCLESCGVFEHKKIRDVPLQIFRADGSVLEILKTGSVLRDRDGHELGAVEVIRRRLPENPDLDAAPGPVGSPAWMGAEMIMGSLGRGFLLLDDELAIVEVSSVLAETLGVAADDQRGRPVSALLGEELFTEGSRFRAALVRGERVEGWRAHARTADGTDLPLSISAAPVTRDANPERDGACSQGRYIVVVRPEPQTDQRIEEFGNASMFEGMVARSKPMLRIFHLIEQMRGNDASVLITGESGTGKELVARAVHARSSRANQPFVAVNCGALPGELLESELFGHARGSFTGAVRDKAGRFEVVEEGTILLDEIGDMPLPLQVKLLRVLQERTFERVGETRSRPFRARVVAATHQDLARLVREKRFRQDLFYRLNVVPIAVPPLRERREDLDLLVNHLLEKIGRRRSRALRLSPSATRELLSFDWPGNVRQLENALEYATAVCEGQTIHREDLPPELVGTKAAAVISTPTPTPAATTPSARPDAAETEAAVAASSLSRYPAARDILDALEQCRNRRGAAAKLLGVSRTTLWRRMREEGLTGASDAR